MAGGKEGKTGGGKPAFTWDDESLVTFEEMNKVLAVILEGEEPAITTRAFHPALPTILARKRVEEATLKDLGRWTLIIYLHYFKEGRTCDWRSLLMKLRGLKI